MFVCFSYIMEMFIVLYNFNYIIFFHYFIIVGCCQFTAAGMGILLEKQNGNCYTSEQMHVWSDSSTAASAQQLLLNDCHLVPNRGLI